MGPTVSILDTRYNLKCFFCRGVKLTVDEARELVLVTAGATSVLSFDLNLPLDSPLELKLPLESGNQGDQQVKLHHKKSVAYGKLLLIFK